MTTTAVFAEILAIGIQTTILLALAVASIADVAPAMTAARGWEAALTIAFLAIAYVLGVITDRLADTLLTPLRNRVSTHDPAERAEMRRRVLAVASPLSTFLEYQRSRMRLLRGTILNLLVAIPVASMVAIGSSGLPLVGVLAIDAVLIALVVTCAFTFTEIVKAQDKWLDVIAKPEALPNPSRQSREALRGDD